MSQSSYLTNPTLLLRLRDLSNEAAWAEFLHSYGPKIYGWCRRYKLQEADATDVTQEVLTKLVRAMRQFDYNPDRGSFRAWLKTVTNNTIRDLVQGWSRPGRGAADSHVLDAIQSIQAPNALADLAAEIEAQSERELLCEAEERVKLRVKPHTWQAYRRTVADGQPAAAVARELSMPVAEVYVAKSRVIKLLRQEVERLQDPQAPSK